MGNLIGTRTLTPQLHAVRTSLASASFAHLHVLSPTARHPTLALVAVEDPVRVEQDMVLYVLQLLDNVVCRIHAVILLESHLTLMFAPVLQHELKIKLDAARVEAALLWSARLPLASHVQIMPAHDHQHVPTPMDSHLTKVPVVAAHTLIAPPEQDSFVMQPTVVVVATLAL